MLKNGEVKDVIKRAAKLTAFVKTTNLNKQLKKTLKPFTKTRWNSTFAMLELLIDNFEDIFQLLCERQRKDPKSNCLDLISMLNKEQLVVICKFLKNFKQITDRIEGDKYETLSMVWPTYFELESLLMPDNIEEEDEAALKTVEEMKTHGMTYLFSKRKDFEPTFKHKIATVLNPLFKKLPVIQERERKQLYRQIEELVQQENPDECTPDENSYAETQENINLLTEKVDPFLRTFCSFDFNSNEQNQTTELVKYLKAPVTSYNQDPTQWWNDNRNEFPKLYKLYAAISCIPASSASAERVFSRAGLIVTNRRSTILPENVNNLIIACNKF